MQVCSIASLVTVIDTFLCSGAQLESATGIWGYPTLYGLGGSIVILCGMVRIATMLPVDANQELLLHLQPYFISLALNSELIGSHRDTYISNLLH